MAKHLWRRDVTDTSTTASDIGTPGEIRRESDGSIYRLVYASASMEDGNVFQLHSTSGSDGYTGGNAWSLSVPVFGVNNTGASVAASAYFFAKIEGIGYVNPGEDLTANTLIVPSTSGLAYNWNSVASDLVASDMVPPFALTFVSGASSAGTIAAQIFAK